MVLIFNVKLKYGIVSVFIITLNQRKGLLQTCGSTSWKGVTEQQLKASAGMALQLLSRLFDSDFNQDNVRYIKALAYVELKYESLFSHVFIVLFLYSVFEKKLVDEFPF